MTGRRRLVAAGCWLAFLAHGMANTAFGPLVTVLEEHFGSGKAAVALLYEASAAGFMLAVLLASLALARFGGRVALIAGCGGFALALLFFGRCRSVPGALAWLLALGFLGGLIQTGANAAVSAVFAERRAFGLNLLHLFYGAGAVAGPRIVALVLGLGGSWGASYYASAGLMLAAALIAALADFPRLSGPPGPAALAAPAARRGAGGVWLVAVLIVLYVGAEVSLGVWTPAYLEEARALPRAAAAAALSNFWLAMGIGRLACTSLARRVPAATLLRVLAAGALAAIAGFLATPDPAAAGLWLTAAGLFCSGIFPTALALAGDLRPDAVAALTGLIMIAAATGNLVFPWLIGLAGARWGLAASLPATAVLAAGVFAAALLAARRRPVSALV